MIKGKNRIELKSYLYMRGGEGEFPMLQAKVVKIESLKIMARTRKTHRNFLDS